MCSPRSDIIAASAAFCLASVLLVVPPSEAGGCNKLETVEAEKAFKNCVESAQSGLIAKAMKPGSRSSEICTELESMLGVCKSETALLGKCKGRTHAANMERLHLSATADILASVGGGGTGNVRECSVFSKKESSPARFGPVVSDGSGGSGGRRSLEEGPRSQPHSGNAASSSLHRHHWTLTTAAVAAVTAATLMRL